MRGSKQALRRMTFQLSSQDLPFDIYPELISIPSRDRRSTRVTFPDEEVKERFAQVGDLIFWYWPREDNSPMSRRDLSHPSFVDAMWSGCGKLRRSPAFLYGSSIDGGLPTCGDA